MKDTAPSNEPYAETPWTLCGVTVLHPDAVFGWRKLNRAETFPLVALLANSSRFPELGTAIANGFKADAAEIDICPLLEAVFVRGGALGKNEVWLGLSAANTDQLEYPRYHWRPFTLGVDGPILLSENEGTIPWLETWKAKTAFNLWAYSLNGLLRSQCVQGALQVRGRLGNALAEREVLESDVFCSEVRVDMKANSIWVGDTRVWNVDIRVNPALKPQFLECPAARTSNRKSKPSDQSDLKTWATSWYEKESETPTIADFITWGKSKGLNRDTVRGLLKDLPMNLKRGRGVRNVKP